MSLNTTLIQNLFDGVNNSVSKNDDLLSIIFDLTVDIQERLKALSTYYDENGENTIEIVNKLCNTYALSGTRLLETFLHSICETSKVSVMLKLIIVKSLLSYDRQIESEQTQEEIEYLNANTQRRRQQAYAILNHLTKTMSDLPTIQQIEAIFMLMEESKYKNESLSVFCAFLANTTIPCDYRYKTLLRIEQFDKKVVCERDFFSKESMFFFIHDTRNMTMYRILAGQYILQNLRNFIDNNERKNIQNILLSIAENTEMDFNLRADAADTLLNVGNEECIVKAREIIILLSFAMGQRKTVFDNAQNVHVAEIEESVSEILFVLMNEPILRMDNEEPITFDFVRSKIEGKLKLEKGTRCNRPCKHTKCEICDNCVKRKNSACCDEECETFLCKKTNIVLSLNRIAVDRVLYSKYSVTLSGILLRVWSYLTRHKSREEMEKRLLEELYDMSGTCSSGFASRLVNVLSGFGEFNIHISWRDQIIANFTGRLNAAARKIDDENSIYMTDENHLTDLVMLYLTANPGVLKIMKEDRKNDIVKKYLKTNRKRKIKLVVEEFKDNVLAEMTINTTNASARSNFLKFFRDNMLKIREEMYTEFREHITDTDFDLWFRAAIMSYETGHTD